MSSVLKLGPGKTGGPLGILGTDGSHIKYTVDLRAVQLAAGNCVRVGGQNDGEVVEDGDLNPNARYLIYPVVTLNPSRYNLILGYNQELLKYGTISAPPMLRAGNKDIFLSISVNKKFNIKDLDHVFELSMID